MPGYNFSLPAEASGVGKAMGLALLQQPMAEFRGNMAHSVRTGIWMVGDAVLAPGGGGGGSHSPWAS